MIAMAATMVMMVMSALIMAIMVIRMSVLIMLVVLITLTALIMIYHDQSSGPLPRVPSACLLTLRVAGSR